MPRLNSNHNRPTSPQLMEGYKNILSMIEAMPDELGPLYELATSLPKGGNLQLQHWIAQWGIHNNELQGRLIEGVTEVAEDELYSELMRFYDQFPQMFPNITRVGIPLPIVEPHLDSFLKNLIIRAGGSITIGEYTIALDGGQKFFNVYAKENPDGAMITQEAEAMGIFEYLHESD